MSIATDVGASDTRQNMADEAVFEKRSFLKLPVAIDVERLVSEFNRIPVDAWGISHWDNHPSIDVMVLRAGTKGGYDDFITDDVTTNPILNDLPYITWLISPDGPFGGAKYGVLFSTKPNGISRSHYDGSEAWRKTVRVHIPIVTNDGAFLIAEGRAKHLPVGEVWTFDNQQYHSVVNGNATRVHMIIDIVPNPVLGELMRNAEFDPGVSDPKRWQMTLRKPKTGGRVSPALFALVQPLTIKEKLELSLKPDGFATKITGIGNRAVFAGVALKLDDVVTSVNGVEASELSRTAVDYIRMNFEPGSKVTLGVMREGHRIEVKVRLKPDYFYSPKERLVHMLRGLGFKIEIEDREY